MVFSFACSPTAPKDEGHLPDLFAIPWLSRGVTVSAGGDVNLGGRVTSFLEEKGFGYPLELVGRKFSLADVSIVNLECCISSQGKPIPGKEFCFRAPPGASKALSGAGVDIVSLANNHSKDFGEVSLLDTFADLEREKVKWCGAGHDDEEAFKPCFLNVKNSKVGFLAFTSIVPAGWLASPSKPGCATTRDEKRFLDSVKYAQEKCDMVVTSFHWGKELATAPSSEQKRLAHLAVDNGADLVIGHHPHVVQGFEVYKNRLIAYSLGNFVFSPPREISSKSVLLEVLICPEGLIQAQVLPVFIRGCRPVLAEGKEGEEWLSTISSYCADLGTHVSMSDGSLFIRGSE
ncbi:MAG: CapA family protein [Actinomycetota bacterium]|nr:CapA family protein [Actinomycetota bacterium]